jgi:signal transduction histidine kinase
MNQMHSLLKRQLKKHFPSLMDVPVELGGFLDVVNDAYTSFDSDRRVLEHSLDISSQELMQANTRLRSIFQALPDLFLRIDKDGRILECKLPASDETYALPPAIIGNFIQNIVSPETRDALERAILSARENKIIEFLEYSLPGENVSYYEARLVSFQDDQLIIIIRNISKRKRAEEGLRQSDKLASLGQLSAGIAHEINNPVGFINSNICALHKYSKVLHEYYDMSRSMRFLFKEHKTDEAVRGEIRLTDFEQQANVAFILSDMDSLIVESMDGIDRIKKIVADLKTFVRCDQGIISDIDLRTIMDSAVNILWNEIKYKVDLIKQYEEISPVKCNPQQIGQVFINMLMNALHAIPEKGRITIRSYMKDTHVCIAISDTGTGIPESIINKIFNPFFTTKDAGKGTGLGLSISYDIIANKHHGSIEVKTREGEGTTFIISLPVEP